MPQIIKLPPVPQPRQIPGGTRTDLNPPSKKYDIIITPPPTLPGLPKPTPPPWVPKAPPTSKAPPPRSGGGSSRVNPITGGGEYVLDSGITVPATEQTRKDIVAGKPDVYIALKSARTYSPTDKDVTISSFPPYRPPSVRSIDYVPTETKTDTGTILTAPSEMRIGYNVWGGSGTYSTFATPTGGMATYVIGEKEIFGYKPASGEFMTFAKGFGLPKDYVRVSPLTGERLYGPEGLTSLQLYGRAAKESYWRTQGTLWSKGDILGKGETWKTITGKNYEDIIKWKAEKYATSITGATGEKYLTPLQFTYSSPVVRASVLLGIGGTFGGAAAKTFGGLFGRSKILTSLSARALSTAIPTMTIAAPIVATEIAPKMFAQYKIKEASDIYAKGGDFSDVFEKNYLQTLGIASSFKGWEIGSKAVNIGITKASLLFASRQLEKQPFRIAGQELIRSDRGQLFRISHEKIIPSGKAKQFVEFDMFAAKNFKKDIIGVSESGKDIILEKGKDFQSFFIKRGKVQTTYTNILTGKPATSIAEFGGGGRIDVFGKMPKFFKGGIGITPEETTGGFGSAYIQFKGQDTSKWFKIWGTTKETAESYLITGGTKGKLMFYPEQIEKSYVLKPKVSLLKEEVPIFQLSRKQMGENYGMHNIKALWSENKLYKYLQRYRILPTKFNRFITIDKSLPISKFSSTLWHEKYHASFFEKGIPGQYLRKGVINEMNRELRKIGIYQSLKFEYGYSKSEIPEEAAVRLLSFGEEPWTSPNLYITPRKYFAKSGDFLAKTYFKEKMPIFYSYVRAGLKPYVTHELFTEFKMIPSKSILKGKIGGFGTITKIKEYPTINLGSGINEMVSGGRLSTLVTKQMLNQIVAAPAISQKAGFEALKLIKSSQIQAQTYSYGSLVSLGLQQKTKYFPIMKQISGTQQQYKTQQQYMAPLSMKSILGLNEKAITSNIFNLGSSQTISQIQKQTTTQTARQITPKENTFDYGFDFKMPRLPPPIIPWLPSAAFPDFTPAGRRIGKRKYKRTPSLISFELGITSPRALIGETTGLIARPILTGRRYKR